MLKHLLLFFIVSFYISSCFYEQIDDFSLREGHRLIIDTALSEIGNGEVIASKKNQEYAFFISKKPTHLHGVIHSNSVFFSKKVFNLFPITSKEEKKKFQDQKKFQKLLAKNGLIGLKSRLIFVHGKGEAQEMFFQEGFDKRIAEANENRDGSIYSFSDKLNCKYSSGSEKTTFLRSNIDQFLDDKLNVSEIFDIYKTLKLFAIIEAESQNEMYNHISFYFNPVSQLLEPFVSLEINNCKSKIISKILKDSIFKKILLDLIQSYKNGNNISHSQMKSLLISNSYPFGERIGEEYKKYFTVKDDIISPKSEKLVISEIIKIPPGYKVIIPPKSIFEIINSGALISYSPIECMGIKGKEIQFLSPDKTSMGLHIINAVSPSIINYTIFDGFSRLRSENWNLPSSITFYESPVNFSYAIFKNNLSEDALNIFRSNFSINRCVFENTFSDALDVDFSAGQVLESSFNDIGNDAIDVSGSKIEIHHCLLENIEDKGLSGGEKSIIKAENITFRNVEIAITSKDESKVEVNSSYFENINLVYCAFEKKKEFGPSIILAENNTFSGINQKYLVERKSRLIENNVELNAFSENVKKMLYGKQFGKKTIN